MRISFILLLFQLSFYLTKAQEQIPVTPKVCVGKDGKLYVNKDLGIYLWLSTSPNKEDPMHRLTSIESEKYSNPFYFDTDGYNTVRSNSAVDPDTRKIVYPLQDIIFKVYADSRPPVTSLIKVKGQLINRSGKLYGGNNLSYVIKAKDVVSGVENTYYSINGGVYNTFLDTISLDTDGETVLKVYSTDKVGNLENPIEKIIFIDNSAPITKYKLDGHKKIILSSEDNLIGVKSIFYQINNESFKIYSSPIPEKLLGNDGSLTFYSVDYLNNIETKTTIYTRNNFGLNIE